MCYVDKEPLNIEDYFVFACTALLALPAMTIVAIMAIGRVLYEKLH